MVVLEAAEVEVEGIPTGTDLTQAVITTPVATPMGMKTYGLDIVVKFDTSLSLALRDILAGLEVSQSCLTSLRDASIPLTISYSYQDPLLTI